MPKVTPNFKSFTQCSFLKVLIWIVLPLVLLFVVTFGLALIAKALDAVNVVKRALAILSPYAPTIPWILMTGLVIYALHLPKIRDAIVSLIERLEEIHGVVRFGSPRMSEEEIERIAEMFQAKTKGPQEVEKVRSEHEREDDRKRLAIERHVQDMGGTTNIPARYEAVQWQYFDGCFRCGDEIVFVIVKRPQNRNYPRANLIGVVRLFDEIKGKIRRNKMDRISLHILFCADENYSFPPEEEDVSRHCIGVRTDVSVYFFLFDKNDVITSKRVVS